MTIPAETVFADLPSGLRGSMTTALSEIVSNYRAGRWEPSELNGGKLCEVAYTILRGYADNSMPDSPAKPRNFVDACRALEQAGNGVPRSVRVQVPRVLMALYEIRNNRGVGHVGGDVDPNHMDATFVVASAKWIVAELVRLLHTVDTATATAIVEALITREVPAVWEVNNKRRVLLQGLTMKQKTLLLLYSEAGPTPEPDLLSWIEHSNPSVFRRDVLRPAHRDRLIEYDENERIIEISPVGVKLVEETIPLSV